MKNFRRIMSPGLLVLLVVGYRSTLRKYTAQAIGAQTGAPTITGSRKMPAN